MSRKWERMVTKNAKTVNKNRLKQGIAPVTDPDQSVVFKGRSILLSLFFVCVAVFLMSSLARSGADSMYWFTTISYFFVGLLIYFVRRPYLKVGRNSLSKRGYAKEKILNAENIKQIIYTPGNILIELDGKSRWGYSKFFNRFDVAAMADKLKRFSEQNNITFVDKTTNG
ncbi:hypothetical protein GK047_02065 [Paenibacillus sp. SYP-B3998]|uniref:Methyltransferase n=1 Tax=Paenibacillus sp. SYP-B3998 TaxID=2678564 RepID=A0A6G3ZRG9_9BACL|nr:hypothetical protein [Paenibacillus sp. SYP-B3998]NEW04803.1 hypothetical protein [Paenibacillus sp. SYP-B3998]